jgi:hypothetical protein
MARKKDPFDGDGKPGGSLKRKKVVDVVEAPPEAKAPKGDLKRTLEESRDELAKERKPARYNAEGVLLNPEDVHVAAEGFVTPKEK